MLVKLRMPIAFLFGEAFSSIARQTLRKIKHDFNEHPNQAGETYLQHLWFTTKMAMRFLYISIVLLIHGLIPFTFTRTASQQTEKIYLIMKSRIPKSRLEEIDEYVI